ncbi:hypothetical protein FTX61_16765 [Nitriliruptoraceae bacterium ZYF776]|nr:hypothetical protein [Profundirhabdus halotolerans]
MTVVVLTHVVATWFLVGLVWTVQVVHYPLFAGVGSAGFAAYAARHSTRITAVLAVPWALEGITTAWLLVDRPPGVPVWLPWLGAVAAAAPVVLTVAAAVPAHRQLGRGFDAEVHRRLMRCNAWRTAAWTAHGVVAAAIVLTATTSPSVTPG